RALLQPKAAPSRGALVPVTVEPAAITLSGAANEPGPGSIEIELPHARLTVRGRVDLDALHTVLALLRAR
ncbi:MAG: hypothetical protein ACKOEM_09090, partial [Planctomycetia bacterium]